MFPFDPPDMGDDPMEALSKFLSDMGLPEDGDIHDANVANVSADLLRSMMKRFVPSPGASSTNIMWETVRQMSRQYVASLGPDPVGSSRALRQISEAVHLGELWMSEATVFAPVTLTPLAWSRADWIEATFPAWQKMLEPVIEKLSTAMASATAAEASLGFDDEMASLHSALQPLMSSVISATFGAHVGEGLGKVATTTIAGTDVGLPLVSDPVVSLLPTNLAAIYQQDELEEADVILYCSVREIARQRLFHDVAWISPHIIALVQHYAREMTLDPESLAVKLENALPEQFSAESIVAFRADFSSLLFTPDTTQEQQEILQRLTTLLALVEGWVDDVTTQVARRWFPGWEPIAESLRRHRATSTLAGSGVTPMLRLNPSAKEVRQASNFWQAIREAKGVEGRDEIWRYPESMPQMEDLSDAEGFLNRPSDGEDPWNDELRKFLDQDPEMGDAPQ